METVGEAVVTMEAVRANPDRLGEVAAGAPGCGTVAAGIPGMACDGSEDASNGTCNQKQTRI